jgi:hypothetical protein
LYDSAGRLAGALRGVGLFMKMEIYINALRVLLELPGQDVDLLFNGLKELGYECDPAKVTPQEVAEFLVRKWKGNQSIFDAFKR